MNTFEFKLGKYRFVIRNLADIMTDEVLVEAKKIVDDLESIKTPQPERKELIFKDLQEMRDWREGKKV